MGQDEPHVLARILIATRRCSAERIDDNDIYWPPFFCPTEERESDRCRIFRFQ